MKKTVISNYQLIVVETALMFGSAPLLISSLATSLAGRDAWLSVIAASIAGLLIVWINTSLAQLYPEKTFVEIIIFLFGKWIGRFFAGVFVFICLVAATQVIWYVGDFFKTMYTYDMTYYQINFAFLFVIVIALLYGIEVVFRVGEIIFAIFFPTYLISMFMVLPNIKIKNVLPIIENGFLPVVKGTYAIFGFIILPIILLNMVNVSSILKLKDYRKSMLKGYLLGMMVVFLAVLMPILVYGPTITTNLRFPLYAVTKEIDLGFMFSRVEALIVFIWLSTNYTAAFFYCYAGIVGLSQILKINDYKKIVLPIALIIFVYSDSIYKNVPYENRWDSFVWPPWTLAFGFVLPLALLVTDFIKKKMAH